MRLHAMLAICPVFFFLIASSATTKGGPPTSAARYKSAQIEDEIELFVLRGEMRARDPNFTSLLFSFKLPWLFKHPLLFVVDEWVRPSPLSPFFQGLF